MTNESISYINLGDGENHPIDAVTVGGKSASEYLTNSDIVDALTFTNTDKALSANQGKVLNDSINNVANSVNTKAPIASPAFTGTATVAAGTNYTTAKLRNIVLSTADPSGGNNGDIWIKYTE